MIKIDKVDVYGWESAIRGLRNSWNSWDKSDSRYVDGFFDFEKKIDIVTGEETGKGTEIFNVFMVGENDLDLMKKLSKAGTDHSKFLRMINVTCDITAPLYFYKEFDTYKVGTVANSCSTMHTITEKEFELGDFSCEHLSEDSLAYLEDTIYHLNHCRDGHWLAKREGFNDSAKDYWWQMIQLLPNSYNQKRTVQMNYQVLKSMYHARKTHPLDEWVSLCEWIETLPYAKELICCE